MAEFTIKITRVFNTTPEILYTDWLNSEGHEEITGGVATIRPEVNAEFEAWDGYISGKILTLVPHQKIVQTWRTIEFAPTDPDSELTILLDTVADGTSFTLIHTGLVSAEAVEKYRLGWEEHYIAPMMEKYG